MSYLGNNTYYTPNNWVFPDGTVSSPSITFLSDLDTGFYRPATNTIAATTNGTECFRLNPTGVVSMGGTAPDASWGVSQIRPLVINNVGGIYSNTTTTTGLFTGLYHDGTTWKVQGTNSGIVANVAQSAGFRLYKTQTGGAVGDTATFTEMFIIDSDDGQVMFNQPTTTNHFDYLNTVAGAQIHRFYNSSTDAGATSVLRLSNNASSTDNQVNFTVGATQATVVGSGGIVDLLFNFTTYTLRSLSGTEFGRITDSFQNFIGTAGNNVCQSESKNGYGSFRTLSSGTNNGYCFFSNATNGERFRLTSNDNGDIAFSQFGTTELARLTTNGFGVGASVPAAKLDIRGAAGAIQVNNTSATANDSHTFIIRTFGGTTAHWNRLGFNASSFEWQIYNNTRMIMDTNANIYIGNAVTTVPAAATGAVSSGVQLGFNTTAFMANSSSNIVGIFNRTNSSGIVVEVKYNGAQVGTISTNGTTTAYNTTSDYRLKQDITAITSTETATFFDNVQPYKWNWTTNPSIEGHGFLAHEVQSLMPQAVTGTYDETDGEGNPVYQGVAYGSGEFISMLVAEIKFLRARVEALENA